MLLTLKWIDNLATSFSSLILHAANLLLWKKIFSLTYFENITVSRPITLLTVFFMGRLGSSTKGARRGLPASPKVWTFLFCWISPPPNKWFPLVSPLITDHMLEKLLDKFYQKFWLQRIFWVTQSWLILKSLLEINPLLQKSVQQDSLPELSP